MQKAYVRVNWENYPSDKTPLSEHELNRADKAIDEIDNRVVSMDSTKASKLEVASLVSEITYDDATGIFTVKRKDGSSFTIDTKLEKIAINFEYDPVTQQIIIILDDGTKQYIDLSALITQYEFFDSATIAFEIDTAGKVTAKIKNASITEDMLQPNYLADIKVEVAKANKSQSEAEKSMVAAANSADAASTSETNAANSAKNAQSYAVGGTNSRTGEDTDNAKYYSQQASASAATAVTSAANAKTSETNAAESADMAISEAEKAENSASIATSKADAASKSAIDADTSAANAKTSETNAAESADTAQDYAMGDTGSAKYYYEQAKAISESFAGALRPMGTVSFAQLPKLETAVAGDMYNISDEFVTTSDFKEGAGVTQPAGTNIYVTTDNKWDCLAGSPVTGIKGANESIFRRGNVNLTAENVGALATDGDIKNTTIAFTTASTRTNIASGEKSSTIFGKIAKWFSELKTVAFTASYNDLSNKPSIDTALSTASTNAVQNKVIYAELNKKYSTDIKRESSTILAAPSDKAGAATFRKLVADDLPIADTFSTNNKNLVSSEMIANIMYGKFVTVNDDWNDITFGFHVVNGSSSIAWSASKHAPVGSWSWGYVFCYIYGTYGYQVYITSNANSRSIYIRSKFNSEWSDWGKVQ